MAPRVERTSSVARSSPSPVPHGVLRMMMMRKGRGVPWWMRRVLHLEGLHRVDAEGRADRARRDTRVVIVSRAEVALHGDATREAVAAELGLRLFFLAPTEEAEEPLEE